MDDKMEAMLAPLGVECIDAMRVRNRYPARILKGWESKPYSILHAPWKEVLLLDADNVPVTNPEFLFDTPEFKETGAVFWPDYGRLERDREIWEVCGVSFRDEPEFESGQILINKEKCWEALNLTMWINEHSDFYYWLIHGDKETYHMAWHMVNQPYSMVPFPIHALHATMCQHDFQGNRIFQHRNMAKWKLWEENPKIYDFWDEDHCFEYLRELENKWDGKINPGVSDWTDYEESDLAELGLELIQHTFEYHRVGHDKRTIRFLPNGSVGEGAADMERYWSLELKYSSAVLKIHSDEDVTCELERMKSGVWKGRWNHYEQMPIELSPVVQHNQDPRKAQKAERDFEEFARNLIAEGEPMSQNAREANLGFGYYYYGLVRNLQPDYVVAIGSARGFMPFCLARGVQDNGWGKVIFIDPSYEGEDFPAWSGRNHWANERKVEEWIERFELTGWIEHLKLTSDDAFALVKTRTKGQKVPLVVIDGDHSAEQSYEDFRKYSTLVQEGYVLFHDSINPACGVAETIERVRQEGYQMITMHQEAGLTLVEIKEKHQFPVDDKWAYLVRNSNRGQLLFDILGPKLLKKDVLMDTYCGSAPLAPFLNDYELFGWDRDLEQIRRLKEEFPHQKWYAFEETQLPYVKLPEKVSVLLGVGISLHGSDWDMSHSINNQRYLVARYLPRVCMFETAEDYQASELLGELYAFLEKLGYHCSWHLIETDMDSFAKRRVVLAERY